MEDHTKTKDQLIGELRELRRKSNQLEVRQAELLGAEKALRASEAQMRAILDGITTNLAFVNENLEIVWANKATGESVGMEPSEMVGKKCHRFFADPDKPCEGCPTARAFKTKKSEHQEMTTPDGRVWDERGEPVFDDQGRFLGVLEIAHDITARKQTEEALRESEERYRDLFENAGDIVYTRDFEGNFTSVNKAVTRILGYSVEEFLRLNARDIVDPDYLPLVSHCTLMIRQGEREWMGPLELRFLAKDGEPRWFEIITRMILKAGKPIGIHAIARDVTERRDAEEALRSSEQMLKSIVEASPVGIGLARERRMVWVNDAWKRMFRFESQSDYLGQDARLVYPSDEAYEEAGEKLYRNLETGIVTEMETVFRRNDGTLFDADIRMKALDPSNLERGTIAVIRDISERKRSEGTLRENERRYRSLFERSMDAILVVRPDGEIIDANSASSDLFGAPRAELIGSQVQQFYWEQRDREVFLRTVTDQGYAKEYPVQVRRADGARRSCVLNSTTLLNDAGEIMAFLSVIRDITESKRLEEQLRQAQKMEAVGTLAGGIAHDFNNLLTVIQGFAELILADRKGDSTERDDLQKIVHTARQGAELVQRILTFSNKAEPDPQPLNINRCVEQTYQFLIRALPKMIAVELRLAPDLAAVNADRAQIEQVLMNLAINAKEAMPDGGTLTFETSNVAPDENFFADRPGMRNGDYVLLRVSDTGRGLDKVTQERIFDPFFTTKQRDAQKGTGLGLPVVLGIVQAHGGWIECSSERGRGTTFAIYLPRLADQPALALSDAEESLEEGAERILLVDDENYVRELGERILTKSGYRVLCAGDGREALELFKRNHSEIGLVILDLIMPGMSGKECLRELIRLDPHVKVIISSGYSVSDKSEEIPPELVRAYVKKPYEVRQLLQAVRAVLDAR